MKILNVSIAREKAHTYKQRERRGNKTKKIENEQRRKLSMTALGYIMGFSLVVIITQQQTTREKTANSFLYPVSCVPFHMCER